MKYMKVTGEEFIRKSNLVHNFKYDYSECNFTKTNNKVTIICEEHGPFEQMANAHSQGQGCPKCGISRANLLTTKIFIEKSIKIHGGRYDYSLVDYKKSNQEVKIICEEHGLFKQVAYLHYTGSGCRKCHYENISRFHKEELIVRANKKHNFKYDYSLLPDMLNISDKVIIICKKGHHFKQNMKDHIGSNRRPNGCRFCSKPCSDTESFIRLSSEKHGNKYDYSKSEYRSQKIKTIITCLRHGDFEQKPGNHYHLGRGCPRCSESKGELEIRKWLESNKINFKKEKTFEYCLNVNRLRFDFYLTDFNICIEYDGLQHFKPIEQFGGDGGFELTKKRDEIKNEYCNKNNIGLLRLNYKNLQRGDIPTILEKYLELVELKFQNFPYICND